MQRLIPIQRYTSGPKSPGTAMNAPLRLLCRRALICGALVGTLFLIGNFGVVCHASVAYQHNPANPNSAEEATRNKGGQPPPRPHLGEWLEQHRDMSLQQQERALRNEPGFNRLSLPKQQRLLRRLQQLNAMPLQQRQRTLDRMEALERLSPQQRQQVRNVLEEVGRLPPAQRIRLRKAFHELSQLPQAQRSTTLNSYEYKSQFSDHERQILEILLTIKPRPAELPLGQNAPASSKADR